MSVKYELWKKVILLLVLVPESISDIHTKKIHLKFVVIMSVFSFLFQLFTSSYSFAYMFGCIIPGLIFIGLSILLKEKIGMGDGFIFLFIGCVCGFGETMEISVFAFTLAAIAGLFLLSVKKANRNTKLAFVPFVLMGAIISEVVVL